MLCRSMYLVAGEVAGLGVENGHYFEIVVHVYPSCCQVGFNAGTPTCIAFVRMKSSE